VSQTWSNENYEQPYYDDQTYPPDYDQDYETPPPAGRRPAGMMSVALIIGVLACSCLSCLIGTGLGLVVWEEMNYSPTSESSSTRPAEPVRPAVRETVRTDWDSLDVVDAFLAAGLECDSPQALLVDDGVAPFVAREATRFAMPSVCDGCSGRIYSFFDQSELENARRYYVDLGNQDSQFFSWIYTRDNILVQLNGQLPEDQALRYRRALTGMR
jgi:hypothetical protein